MPWKECSVTEERLRFVARLLEGEGMSEVCREFGISRKTGYKIFNRYESRARCPVRSVAPAGRYANQLPAQVERITPGHPQQNGRHERMHLTLKKEATRPPSLNSLQQQAKFDAFMREFNAERPHQALAMKCPAELYTASPRPYHGLPELEYPLA